MELLGLTLDEMKSAVRLLGESPFRAGQICNWLYKQNALTLDVMVNLPVELRQKMAEAGWIASVVEPKLVRRASDGTTRFLFRLQDGESVEGVYLPETKRHTVCLSSQVGCGIQCAFCATGRSGMIRNLTTGEMVDSVRRIGRETKTRISHVVVMGQGEPLANYDHVMKALEIINAPYGLGIAARHITISTCGIIPRILELAEVEQQYNLAISLHATRDGLRDKLIPVNRRYPLHALREACQVYTQRSGRRITLEYIMLRDVNDHPEDLQGLIDFAKGWLTHINLIPFHKVSGAQFDSSVPSVIRHFLDTLERAGIPATMRKSRGEEVSAACGQLRQEALESEEDPK